MKRLLLPILFILLTFNTFAENFYSVDLIYTDGTTKSGFAAFFEDVSDEYIYFKQSLSNPKEKQEKIEASKLKSIVYKINGKDIVYDQIKPFYGFGYNDNKIGNPGWLLLIERGTVSLYTNRVTMSGGMYNSGGGFNVAAPSAQFTDYYCIRSTEPAAKRISTVASFNSNSVFKHNGPIYFSDYVELVNKINSKEYTYKDLLAVVREYNKWFDEKSTDKGKSSQVTQ